jgi:hypothetical protein
LLFVVVVAMQVKVKNNFQFGYCQEKNITPESVAPVIKQAIKDGQ